MKQTFRLLAMLFLGIMLWPASASAQFDPMAPLPADPEVRTGVLPNGLSYYIRHNEYPKGLAEFYIAQKVGSMLEEEEQRGLAHFLEHMCFNGTENFPGTSLRDWLASIGVKFGADLNAYTSFDKTVYNISNVPVGRESVQDSCLLILHDWADGLLLEPEEIDSERGVIHQEWRRTQQGQMRILETLLPVIYKDSKYGHRLPIGLIDVIDNFPYQAIRDYYETWYRPDQQGILVVGDIDVDRIEGRIKEMFGPIKMPENPKERVYYPVADHEGTIYAIGHDKEMPQNIVEMMFLMDATPDSVKNTPAYLLDCYTKMMVESMLNARLQKLLLDPASPAASASVDFGEFFVAKTKDAFNISAVSKTSSIEPALEMVYREVVRAARNGFSASEYDRARSEYLANLENVYNNRSTRNSHSYVLELVDLFCDNEPAPGIEVEYNLMKQLAPMIPVEALNQILPQVLTDDNRVVMVLGTEAEGVEYPTEDTLSQVIEMIEDSELEPWVDNVKEEPLIPELPAPGKVVATETDKVFDATVWTLSNGVKVYVKPTKLKEDQILFNALANHGTSVYPEDYAASIILLNNTPISLGTYTSNDLDTYLKGKTVDINLNIDDYVGEVEGSCSPKDLPTLMELIYAGFTEIGMDQQEFEALQSMLGGYLANMTVNPQYVFGKDVQEALYSSPRKQMLTTEVIESVNADQIRQMRSEFLSNAADFTFYFVGNVDLETLKPLVEQYIATLPADASKSVTKPEYIDATRIKGGKGMDSYTMDMTTPQTYLAIVQWADLPYSAKSRIITSMLGQVLTQRLIDNVREKEGAVYSIGAAAQQLRVSPQNITIQVSTPIDPEKRDLVLKLVEKEFNDMQDNISPEELSKVQEYLIKSFREGLEKNEAWLGFMGGVSRNGVDTYTGYEELVGSITTADLTDFMKQINNQGNYRVVLLEPAK